jgi:hypothetical protein
MARMGSVIGNFLLCDSQDIAGVSPVVRQASTVWIIGAQREANELKRTLGVIKSSGTKAPKPAEVGTLRVGEFFACWGSHAIKTYVQPSWMSNEEARAYAMGERSTIVIPPIKHPDFIVDQIELEKEITVTETEASLLRAENDRLRIRIKELERPNAIETSAGALASPSAPVIATTIAGEPLNFDNLYQQVKQRLIKEQPGLIKLLVEQPEIELSIERPTVKMDGKSLKGRLARMIHQGFFRPEKDAKGKTQGAARAELKRTGSDVNTGNLSTAFSDFVSMGFLTNENGEYAEVPSMRKNIVAA